MTCDDCGHPAHAGRCEIWTARIGMTAAHDIPPRQCPCSTRRNDDGDADGTGAGDGGAECDDSVRRGSGDDVAVLTEGMERSGDVVVAEMKRIKGKFDASLPLVEEFCELAWARLGGTR